MLHEPHYVAKMGVTEINSYKREHNILNQERVFYEVGKVSTYFAAAKNGKVGSNFSAAKNGQVSSNSKKR